MKIKYLGTAAAEGIPALFCDCRICQHARENRGKNIRTRSQAVIDDKILIDFPPDTYMHALYHGLDLKRVRTCVITHNHADHLYERDFWCRAVGIAYGIEDTVMDVYLTKPGYDQTQEFFDKELRPQDNRVAIHEIQAFEPFEAEGYRFIPLRTDHRRPETVIYLIEHEDKTLLYAHDTGIFPEETWKYLESYGRKIDMVSLDCTGVLIVGCRTSHMGLDANNEVKERLLKLGLCDENTKFYSNHFSHGGGTTHDELVVEASKYGLEVSYDGLEVEF